MAKIVIRKTKGIEVKISQSTHDWEVRDKKSGKLIKEGKKS